MEFSRRHPPGFAARPYVFTIIDGLKVEARRAGIDVIDLGFGNPDIPSPELAVDKLCEAAHNTRNHRYSASKGIPKLRQAVAEHYQRRFGVTLDPDLEVLTTIGSKEGFSHLMWVLLGPATPPWCPSPSYPIHIWGPLFAGAAAREIPMSTDGDFIERVREAYKYSWPKPRVLVLSFPTTHHRLRRPRVLPADGRLRPRERGPAGPRQRLRRARLRRLPAALDPPGRRGQGVRGRAVLDDQGPSPWPAGAWPTWSASPRSCRRWPSSSPTSTTAPSSRSRSRPP
jgi:hypothetical protein